MNYVYNNVYTGDGRSGNLSKEQFATIVEGALVYDEGKDDYYVFGGMKNTTKEWVPLCLYVYTWLCMYVCMYVPMYVR